MDGSLCRGRGKPPARQGRVAIGVLVSYAGNHALPIARRWAAVAGRTRVRAPQLEHATGSAIVHGLRSQWLILGPTFPLPVLIASVAHAALAFAGVLLRTAAPRIACGYLGRKRLQGLAQPAAVTPTVGPATG